MQRAALVRRAVAVAVATCACMFVTVCSSDDAPGGSAAIAPTVTATVATDAPTTTQVPTAATPLVRQAVLDYWAAQQRCQQRPQACRPATFTAAQGTIRADVQAAVDTLLDSGWHLAATADGDPDNGYVAVGSIVVADDGTSATADECVYDPNPLMSGGGVVTADAVPHRIIHTLALENGTWLVADEEVDATTSCDNLPASIPPNIVVPTATATT